MQRRQIPVLSVEAKQRLAHAYACCRLEHIAVLRAAGAGVADYLQGQLTQDVSLLSHRQGIYACALTPQGKPVADLYLLRAGEHEVLMLCEAERAEALVARLRRFSIGYSLRIGIVADMAVAAIAGAEAEQAMARAGLVVPAPGRYAAAGSAQVLALRHEDGNIRLLASAATIAGLLHEWDNEIEAEAMEAMRILRGIPRFGIDWDERELPLNANLIERGGVSFAKGCYVGQEVTSRMHWRGGRRRRLYRMQLKQPPASLPAAIGRRDLALGRLTSAAVDAETNTCLGIASLPLQLDPVGLAAGKDNPVQVLGACGAEGEPSSKEQV